MALNIPEFLGTHIKDIIYIGGAIATFFIGRRLRQTNIKKAEVSVQTSELDNIEAAVRIYRTMLGDLQTKLNEAEQALEVLEKRLHDSLEEKRALEEENIKLKREIDELKSNH